MMCMRTTLNVPDALMTQLKARAAAADRTVTSLVEEALRDLLARVQPERPDVTLPTFGTRGGRVLVDVADNEAAREAMDTRT